MQEKYKDLRKPLTANDIELRVGNISEKGASFLLYKTARIDTKRLDEVFNGRWKRKHYMDGKGNIVCEISIYDTELKEWISREDVGTESNTEKEKGAYSDSFKRAGFAWGIGVELYNAPFIFIKCETKRKDGGKGFDLVDKFYFNDAIVSKFAVENDNVFVEIKKKNDIIYTNFPNSNITKTETKQVSPSTNNTPQQAEKHIIENASGFDKLKTELMEAGTLDGLKNIWLKCNKTEIWSKFNDAQKVELTNIKDNTKKQIEQLNNAN